MRGQGFSPLALLKTRKDPSAQGRSLRADAPTYWLLTVISLKHGKVDTLFRVWGATPPQGYLSGTRNLHIRVGGLGASHLLQGDDHPAHHHRHKAGNVENN